MTIITVLHSSILLALLFTKQSDEKSTMEKYYRDDALETITFQYLCILENE